MVKKSTQRMSVRFSDEGLIVLKHNICIGAIPAPNTSSYISLVSKKCNTKKLPTRLRS